MDNISDKKLKNVGVTVSFPAYVLEWLDEKARSGRRSRNAQIRIYVEKEFRADRRVKQWLADAAAEG